MTTRRNFLQTLSAPVLAIPFLKKEDHDTNQQKQGQMGSEPKNLGDNMQGSEKILRVALMGLGSYANRVAEAMRDSNRAKLVGVISGTPSKIKDWQSRFNLEEKNCYNYENYWMLKDNPDIDAVYVCTPNSLHHSNVLKIAGAGKHAITEKPMAVNAKEAEEMILACKKAGVKLLVGYRMHFEPKTLEIIRQREAGEYGKVLFFQGLMGFIIGNPTQWRLSKQLAGGGAMMDIGIYAINGARYMIGEEPIWVTAQEVKTDKEKFKEGVDETITFQLGFPGGAVASCLSTYSLSNNDRFFLNGTKGWAELLPATGYGPIMGRTSKGELNFKHVTHQTVQMDEFASIILEDKKPLVPVDGEEGLKDMKIIDAIYMAVKSGKKIELSL